MSTRKEKPEGKSEGVVARTFRVVTDWVKGVKNNGFNPPSHEIIDSPWAVKSTWKSGKGMIYGVEGKANADTFSISFEELNGLDRNPCVQLPDGKMGIDESTRLFWALGKRHPEFRPAVVS